MSLRPSGTWTWARRATRMRRVARGRATHRPRRGARPEVVVALVVLLVAIPVLALHVASMGEGPASGSSGARASVPLTHSAAGPSRPAGGVSPRATGPSPSASAPSSVRGLSANQLAGERVVYAFSGVAAPRSLLRAIRAGRGAGVILFSSNLGTPTELRALVSSLQRAGAASPLHAPLLVLTDQEGGDVRRLPGAPALSERAIGSRPQAQAAAARAGVGAARTLRAGGVNVNLAPVLDVFRQPGDFIDEFHRSYSNDPRVVAQLGAAFIVAQQRAAVAATGKHFPGLGAAVRGQDTDVRPVSLDPSLRELRAIDEAPYRRAIAAGVRLIMVSWAVYPALDAGAPAGLSARVIGGELRGRLGFSGVTITDALGAGALARFGSLPRRGLLAARAGADLLICTAVAGDDDPANGAAVQRALARAIAAGRLNRGAAEQAAARVLALRRSLPQPGR